MRRTILTLAAGMAFLITGGDLRAQEGDAGDAADETDAPHLPADSMELGAKYIDWFLNGDADSLFSHMTPEAQERVGSPDGILDAMDQVLTRVGVQAEVVEQKYVMRNGMPQYWHTASFTDFDEPIQIRWVITPDGMIAGVGINPLSQAPETDAAPAPAAPETDAAPSAEPAPADDEEPAPADAAEPPEAPAAPESP